MKNLIFICVVCLSLAGCSQESRKQAKSVHSQELSGSQETLEEAPEEMFSSFSLSGYAKGGKKQWDLEGKSADIMAEEIKLTDVTGRVYGKEINMTIVADKGSLNRIDNNVHLEKNVKATTDDGATLTTDYLDWDAQNQKLSSDAAVWIKRGMMEAAGTGIVGQPTLSLVQLRKDVTVKLFLEEAQEVKAVAAGPPMIITCDGSLKVDYQNNLAIFQDNVEVEDRRGEIFADKMDVYLAKESKKKAQGMEGMGIEKVIATGDVEIHHGENITYSQKAVYDADTGKLTLTGQPKLVIYSTEDLGQFRGAK